MGVDRLTPLQEDFVESVVGWPEAYVHKETEELAEDQDAARHNKDHVLRRMKHQLYANITCKAETGAGKIVVYRTMPDGTRKGRAVIDIRGLNAVTQADVYPLPLQSDLISSVKDCLFISVVDCASFFYQWRVHYKDRHKLTVISHRGLETFNDFGIRNPLVERLRDMKANPRIAASPPDRRANTQI